MGGQQLWDKLAGEYGLKCLPSGNTGVQMGGWFNKEINSADDLKGLKMRILGLGGDVMAKLGARRCRCRAVRLRKPGVGRDRSDRVGWPVERLRDEVL